MQINKPTTEDLIIIETSEEVEALIEYIKDKEYVSFDTETTGVTSNDEIIGYSICAEQGLAFYVILSKYNKELDKLDYLDTKDASYKLVESLIGKSLIMHNAVFDCFIVQAFFKINLMPSLHTDTMVLAHLLDENRRIGLKELGAVLFGQESKEQQTLMKQSVHDNGGQLTKKTYEMYKADAHLMANYGAKDAILTFNLFLKFTQDLKDQGLYDFFYKEESMPLLKGPTYELNTVGLSVDTKRLNLLKKQLEVEILEARDYIYEEIAPYIKTKYPGDKKSNTFNIGSTNQLSWLLFGEMQLEYGSLTKEGKNVCKSLSMPLPYTGPARRNFITQCIRLKDKEYVPAVKSSVKSTRAKKIKDPWAYIACDKSTLRKLAPKFKWIEKLLDYQRKSKLLSTYVEGIESRMRYGVIQPSFLQTGTTSGRYSSRNPNFQNLPRDDKRIKECIIARPGKVFVGADYSQLEPRVFAYLSGDKRLLEAFQGQDDFYSVIGMEVYDKLDCIPRKDGSPDAFGVKYKKLRDLSKVIALASTYGATAHQLAPTTGKSADDTQEDINSYFEKFPNVYEMMLESHRQVRTQGFVKNIFGRPRRLPDAKNIPNRAHKDLPYEFRNILNLSVNHRIQSTGASIVNRAAIRFHEYIKEAGFDAKLVVQVHDSLVVECKKEDAEDILVLLQDAMENTTVLEGIRLEAIPKIGNNLAEV